MLRWLGDVLKRVIVNVITFAIVGGLLYWFVLRPFI